MFYINRSCYTTRFGMTKTRRHQFLCLNLKQAMDSAPRTRTGCHTPAMLPSSRPLRCSPHHESHCRPPHPSYKLSLPVDSDGTDRFRFKKSLEDPRLQNKVTMVLCDL